MLVKFKRGYETILIKTFNILLYFIQNQESLLNFKLKNK